MKCPNCQEEIITVDGGFTPHFDRVTPLPSKTEFHELPAEEIAKRFSCVKHPNVINALSGELDAVIDAVLPAVESGNNETVAFGTVSTN